MSDDRDDWCYYSGMPSPKAYNKLKDMGVKKWYFYSKRDKKKEPIGLCEAINIDDALENFSVGKSLDRDEFLKLFEIEEERR